ILRMGKQHGPAIPNPVMEIDCALRRFGGEIGRFVVDAQRHGFAPPKGLTKAYRLKILPHLSFSSAAGRLQDPAGVPRKEKGGRSSDVSPGFCSLSSRGGHLCCTQSSGLTRARASSKAQT